MKTLNVAIIGQRFMGRVHSHAWRNVQTFFDLDVRPVMKVACGRDEASLNGFARRWGWQETETDWRVVTAREDIDIVDIAVPHDLHHDIAVEAARAGKHIFCEKPLALNASQARSMLAAVEGSGVANYVNFCYRRCPAVALAKQMIEEDRIGRIFHWRGAYLNSRLVDPQVPLGWTMLRERSGSGPQGALNSHSIDLARYLVAIIASVMAMEARFIPERPVPQAGSGQSRGAVTVEDSAFMVVEFAGGALGSFDTSRFATGRKNYNYFEIYGSKGSLLFDFERMNELEFFSREAPAHIQGFSTILATERMHPYLSAWWPPGHPLGYEHSFFHAVADFLGAVNGKSAIAPSFRDGLRVMEIIDAALESARSGRKVAVPS